MKLQENVEKISGYAVAQADLIIGEMRPNDISTFIEITQENDIYFLPEDLFTNFAERSTGIFLVAGLPTGEVVGTCCVFWKASTSRGRITALAVGKSCDNKILVYEILLKEACSRVPQEVRFLHINYPNIPMSILKDFAISTFYGIRLYSAKIENIEVDSLTIGRDDEIQCLDIRRPYSITTKYTSERGMNTTTIVGPFPNTIVSYTVHRRKDIFGYGSLTKLDESKWLIGPVYGFTQGAARNVFKAILRYIKVNDLTGTVFTYIIDSNKIAANCLEDAGFEMSSSKWRRLLFSRWNYPMNGSEDTLEANADEIIFAFSSTVIPSYQSHLLCNQPK